MGVVEWICVAVVAGAAYVGRQLLRYPGGWRFAVSSATSAQTWRRRAPLEAARDRWQALTGQRPR
jgi:hypothetical protein